eukprot:TRINITY_DN29094_c0_g1_i1.p1 TRINITY_DN29094_c0_g1~~TRINITY_DN29094_c0_g1_i1.p1  ORF type:complete len:520 (+),score=81.20 TRINITY_DN29094_c0_g1_i1:31-1560(+)
MSVFSHLFMNGMNFMPLSRLQIHCVMLCSLIAIGSRSARGARVMHGDAEGISIDDGAIYAVQNVNSGKFLNVIADSLENEANVQQHDNPDSKSSQWRFWTVGSNTFALENVNSGRLLNVIADSKDKGANVQQYGKLDEPLPTSSRWKFMRLNFGDYIVTNAQSRMALNVEGSSMDDGANVQQYTNAMHSSSHWRLYKIWPSAEDDDEQDGMESFVTAKEVSERNGEDVDTLTETEAVSDTTDDSEGVHAVGARDDALEKSHPLPKIGVFYDNEEDNFQFRSKCPCIYPKKVPGHDNFQGPKPEDIDKFMSLLSDKAKAYGAFLARHAGPENVDGISGLTDKHFLEISLLMRRRMVSLVVLDWDRTITFTEGMVVQGPDIASHMDKLAQVFSDWDSNITSADIAEYVLGGKARIMALRRLWKEAAQHGVRVEVLTNNPSADFMCSVLVTAGIAGPDVVCTTTRKTDSQKRYSKYGVLRRRFPEICRKNKCDVSANIDPFHTLSPIGNVGL